MTPSTSKRAKLFQNGRSQAVRLPKEFRFAGTEVVIERRGADVVLSPVDGKWARFVHEIPLIDAATADAMDRVLTEHKRRRKAPVRMD